MVNQGVPRRSVVLAEGHDPRAVYAAYEAQRQGVAQMILLGPKDALCAEVQAQGASGQGLLTLDPEGHAEQHYFAQTLQALPRYRALSLDAATLKVQEPLNCAALLVHLGLAHGSLGGVLATTAATIRAALHIIGTSADTSLVSSFFLMRMPAIGSRLARVLAFGDCALSVDPNAEELAAIAVATAHSFTQATNEMARVALLSYSTLGSGLGASVNKVRSATELARVMAPDLMIDGELQFDAAFLPEVAAHKGVNSSVAGRANVFIFPNLDAGNIGYKIAQRLGGGQAVGPILQGLLKPANDLSRGCSADDIFEMIKITAAQAQAQAPIIHAPVFEKL